tara:strand:- start:1154 stop:1885 length:732 start_codon:yes stop_codon:yes gene_type:complete
MSSSIKDLFIEEFLNNNLNPNDEVFTRFVNFSEFLIKENTKYNLTSIVDLESILIKHFIDSILGFEQFIALGQSKNQSGINFIDFGTGPGFPSMPILIYDLFSREEKLIKSYSLIEANQKKCKFLNKAIKILDLGKVDINVQVERLENANYTASKSKILLTGRAVSKPEKIFKNLSSFMSKNNLDILEFLYFAGPNNTFQDRYSFSAPKSKKQYLASKSYSKEYTFSKDKYSREIILYQILTN